MKQELLSLYRYVDRVSEMLQQKLNQAELLLAKREALSRKRHEALREQGVLEPKLDRLQERTRELQQLVRVQAGLPPASPLLHALPSPWAFSCRSKLTSPSAMAGARCI